MEVNKDTFEPLFKEYASIARANEGVKWIFNFDVDDRAYSEAIFHNFIGQVRCIDDAVETLTKEVLTVTPTEGGALLKVYGVSAMSKYCKNESLVLLDKSSHKFVQRIVQSSASLPDELPLLVRTDILQTLEPIGMQLPASWGEVPKHYSIERTFEYNLGECTYIVRMVRDTSDSFMSMQESNVSIAKCKYIYELLWTDLAAPPERILSHILRMSQIITQTAIPLSKNRIKEILQEYGALVDKHVDKNWKDKDKIPFVAPKPITLEQKHLVESTSETYGNTNIWKGYCVTDKADGERMLCYIAKDGSAYFINNDLEVRAASFHLTGTKSTGSATLLDGEYVAASARTDGSTSDLFAAFDIYFFEGQPVYKYPLMHKRPGKITGDVVREADDPQRYGKTRNDILKSICAKALWKSTSTEHELVNKTHSYVEDDDMRDACRALLGGKANLPYDIDGLIFTPADLGVCGYYPGRDATFPLSMRWDMVFKWKPAEQNTIDFLIEEVKPPLRDTKNNKIYHRFNLFTGYNQSQLEPISVKDGIRMRYGGKQHGATGASGGHASREDYVKRLFKPVTHVDSDVSQACLPSLRGKDGSILSTDTIVEFAYDLTEPIAARRWVPLRVREDKTRTYQKGRKDLARPDLAVSKTANDYTVAASIWRSIHNPVTIEMLTQSVEITSQAAGVPQTLDERLLSVDDVYYAREVPRQHMLSVHMLNFHNNGVKAWLYQYSKNKACLLELACGKAGDMPRWRDSKSEYRFVLGIDLVKDNICKASDGAYARMIKTNSAYRRYTPGMQNTHFNHVFAIGDCAKPVNNGQCTDDPDSKELIDIVFRRRSRDRIDPIYTHINGAAANGFNVVSCQFAIHYFFQNEQILNGFLDNVSVNLRQGGLFIVTFMDGQLVDDLLKTKGNGIAEGRKLDGRVCVWSIIKRYDRFDQDAAFGKTVEVYLENTAKLIPEYLVHTPTLISKMKEKGMTLVETNLFSNDFTRILGDDKHPCYRDVKALENDTVQTQFSFLNRWMIFQKD
jgi:hypothetical protein